MAKIWTIKQFLETYPMMTLVWRIFSRLGTARNLFALSAAK